MDPKISYATCLNLFVDDLVHPVYKVSILKSAIKCNGTSKRFEAYACLARRAALISVAEGPTILNELRAAPYEWAPCIVRVANTSDAAFVAEAYSGLLARDATVDKGAVLAMIDRLYEDRKRRGTVN